MLLLFLFLAAGADGQSTSARPRIADSVARARPLLRPVRRYDGNVEVRPGARLTVESAAVAFGDVIPGTDVELRDAVRIRVFSSGNWALRLLPDAPALAGEGGAAVPVSRISWRTRSGAYVRFTPGMAVIVTRGSGTSSAGELVSVDLKIRLESADELGRYSCNFGMILESP